MKITHRRIAQVVFLCAALAACGRRQAELNIMPPASFPLSRGYVGYGVVSASFIHIMAEPAAAGESVGILRRGTQVRVLERRIISGAAGGPQIWLRIEADQAGWVAEDVMDIFYSENRARTAAQVMNR